MLKGQVIVIFSLMKFDGLASTNFTIAKYLARDNDVYYMEHPYTLKDYFKADKKSEAFKTRAKGFSYFGNGLLQKKVDGVNILISNPVLPTNFLPKGLLYKAFYKINEQIVVRRIKKLLKAKGVKDFIFINFYNFHYPTLWNQLSPRLKIYYCVDPIPDYDVKHGIAAEKKLVEDADVVVCTSKALYDEKKKANPNTYFVANASDLVSLVEVKNDSTPSDFYPDVKRPVIGYVGAIERRMNFSLLKDVIEQRPSYSFLFVGPVYKEYVPEWFFQQKNVFFREPVAYSDVPDLIKSMDVCIIPFQKDQLSRFIFPLKLFEYMGMGKPVVLTDFNPDIREFTKNTVSFAVNAAEFCTAIDEALSNDHANKVQERIAIAKENTWEQRGAQLTEILKEHIA